MFAQDQNVILLVVAGTIMLLLLGMFIISFLFFYQRKHNQHIAEQEQLRSAFRQEVLKARIEMQEQTLMHISREIHDNITQVLSFVKLDLAMIANIDGEQKQVKINESRELVSQAINDLRDLSKSLSFEHITRFGLVKTIEAEADRLNKSGVVKAVMSTKGTITSLGDQRELVLFRIFQESLNNMLKYSGAKHFKIGLEYYPELFNLTLEDDGKGFSSELINKGDGAGLRNMENRAGLIGAVFKLNSSPGNGCRIDIALNPLELRLYTDDDHPDSFG
jgi:signal transduction histidine kinase